MAKNKVVGIHEEKLEQANVIMDVLAHELRLEIIHYLLEKGEAIVGDIYRHLDITQSMTSQHLKELRDVNILNVRAEHKHRFYSVNQERLQEIQALIEEFFPSEKTA
ncbi:MAG TPA: metalloregulator ArsR/SmtB family transcription factor [Chitinophagales bacterium]